MALSAGFAQAVTYFTAAYVVFTHTHIRVSTTVQTNLKNVSSRYPLTHSILSPLPVLASGEEKTDILLRGPGNEALLASLPEEQRAALRKAIAERINADIAAGVAVGNEALVLVVRK